MNNRKILSEETVFKSKYFKIDRVNIKINNSIITKDIIRRSPSVFIIALNEKKEICLVSQYRDALGARTLELVAGTIDGDEEPSIAAKRELEEEAGFKALNWQKLLPINIAANFTFFGTLFLATSLQQVPSRLELDEDGLEVHFVRLDKAIDQIFDGEITNAPTIAGILAIDYLIKNKKIKI